MEVLFVHLARKTAEFRNFTPAYRPYCGQFTSCALWRAVAAEFIGTMILVFLGCGVAMTTSDSLKIGLAFGLGAIASVQMVGHISGAHINPAVSVSALISLDINALRCLLYILSQCAGGIAGAAILLGLFPPGSSASLGSTVPSSELTIWQAFGVEFILTFVLVFANAAINDVNVHVAGHTSLPVGLMITGLHLFAVPLTGCGINPARSLGPAVVSGTWTHHWIYWAGPIGGSVLAAVLYKYLINPFKDTLSVEEAVEKAVFSDPLLRQILRFPDAQPKRSTLSKSLPCRGRTLWDRLYTGEEIPTIYAGSSDYEIIPHFSTGNLSAGQVY